MGIPGSSFAPGAASCNRGKKSRSESPQPSSFPCMEPGFDPLSPSHSPLPALFPLLLPQTPHFPMKPAGKVGSSVRGIQKQSSTNSPSQPLQGLPEFPLHISRSEHQRCCQLCRSEMCDNSSAISISPGRRVEDGFAWNCCKVSQLQLEITKEELDGRLLRQIKHKTLLLSGNRFSSRPRVAAKKEKNCSKLSSDSSISISFNPPVRLSFQLGIHSKPRH